MKHARTIQLLLTLALVSTATAADKRVILISVDGLRPDVINETTTPNISAMRDAGVRASLALNDLPSMTLPNHATMLTGLVSDRHGLILNFDLPGKIPQKTMFEYAVAAGKRGAFYATKSKLSFLAKPESLEAMETLLRPAETVAAMLTQLTADGPDLFFLHLKQPDSAGHGNGWLSTEYLAAVTEADAMIGLLLDAIAADTQRDTYVLLTADHGGSDRNHFVNTPENRTIPWIVVGPDISPGVLQTTVTTADTMPTVLWLLGIEVPKRLSGKAQTTIKNLDQEVGAIGFLPIAPVGLPCVLFVAAPVSVLAYATLRRGSRHA